MKTLITTLPEYQKICPSGDCVIEEFDNFKNEKSIYTYNLWGGYSFKPRAGFSVMFRSNPSEEQLYLVSSHDDKTNFAANPDIYEDGYNYDNGYSWFSLSMEQLLAICTTQSFDLTTDLPLPSNAQFNELPIFASRFYNIAFNRMKFMYSVHVNLITDSME